MKRPTLEEAEAHYDEVTIAKLDAIAQTVIADEFVPPNPHGAYSVYGELKPHKLFNSKSIHHKDVKHCTVIAQLTSAVGDCSRFLWVSNKFHAGVTNKGLSEWEI